MPGVISSMFQEGEDWILGNTEEAVAASDVAQGVTSDEGDDDGEESEDLENDEHERGREVGEMNEQQIALYEEALDDLDAKKDGILMLWDCPFRDIGARCISYLLRTNTVLQDLVLHSNGITDVGCTALAQSLCVNRTLQRLCLDFNRIQSAGCAALGHMFRVNTSLRSLALRGNHIRAAGCDHLASALRVNSTLVSLDFSQNRAKNSGGTSLGGALRVNSTLQTLELTGNQIRGGGCTALAEGLRRNVGLKKLDLGDNEVRGRGCAEIGRALQVNCALERLILCNNGIGDEGFTALGNALTQNTTLRILDLHSNCVTHRGCTALGESMCNNSTLLCLDLTRHDFRPEFLSVWAKTLRVNWRLIKLCVDRLRLDNHADTSTEEADAAALALGITLRDCPRQCPFILTEFSQGSGSRILHKVVDALGVSEDRRTWSDTNLTEHFHKRHLASALAFAMGLTGGLGEMSLVRLLNPNIVDMVLRTYFGMPLYG